MTISDSDRFRSIDAVFEIDQRHLDAAQLFAGSARSLNTHHSDIAGYVPSDEWPEDVTVLFETARNLYLYAWYVYRFTTAAQAQAYAALEMGLRARFEKDGLDLPKPRGLRTLLDTAIDNGWLKDGGFPHLKGSPIGPPLDPQSTEFCRKLPDILPGFRNTYAHGGTTLLDPGNAMMALDATHAILNQLFPK